jgi:hypothetical protein
MSHTGCSASMKPLDSLEPALELLADNLDVLSATGGVVEDMRLTNIDMIEHTFVNKDSCEVTEFLKTRCSRPAQHLCANSADISRAEASLP